MGSDRSAGLHVSGVTVRFDASPAVAGVDLGVEPSEVVALLGPSGCGKTTLLRAVAGLQPIDSGTVSLAGVDLTDVPVHRRGVGLMFQDYALFPHRTVEDNVAFGLRMQRRDRAEVSERTAAALALVGLERFAGRSVSSLSGGEQQRVALARAIAPEPAALLLDEPLGSLDREIRQRLLDELSAILATIDASVLYVTHDQEEAFALGDRVAIMRAGRIERVGAPADVWSHPQSAFVASFLGLGALVAPAGTARGGVATPWGTVVAGDDSGVLLVRPGAVAVNGDGPVAATVASCQFRAGAHLLTLDTPFGAVRTTVDGTPPPLGAAVRLSIDDRLVQPLSGPTPT